MPCKFINYRGKEYTATQMLDASPLEFLIEQYGWQCKLGFNGKWSMDKRYNVTKEGKYLLWVNGTTVTTLP